MYSHPNYLERLLRLLWDVTTACKYCSTFKCAFVACLDFLVLNADLGFNDSTVVELHFIGVSYRTHTPCLKNKQKQIPRNCPQAMQTVACPCAHGTRGAFLTNESAAARHSVVCLLEVFLPLVGRRYVLSSINVRRDPLWMHVCSLGVWCGLLISKVTSLPCGGQCSSQLTLVDELWVGVVSQNLVVHIHATLIVEDDARLLI